MQKRMLLAPLMFLVPCLSATAQELNSAIESLEKSKGSFDVIEVIQVSDDRTHLIEISHQEDKIWLKNDQLSGWTASWSVPEESMISLEEEHAETLLKDWLVHNQYDCKKIQAIDDHASTKKEDLIALTFIELIDPAHLECSPAK
ncbi:hypothetical protein ACPA5B_09495 [Pseudomonas solani]|uniref:hypothetical protein n=1 Tax=Pseudomonas solani TaxID=2731552 RepID=UPI003C2D70A1